MSEWFGEPLGELPRPDDSQRARLREMAQEWQCTPTACPATSSARWQADLNAAVREFAEKHNISLEEAPTEADSSAEGTTLEEE